MKKSTLTLLGTLFLTVSALIAVSCAGAERDDAAYLYYLSLDPTLEADSRENAAVFREAIRRMDPYVSFRKKEFALGKVTAADLNMSEVLFDQLASAMRQTNDLLEEVPAKYDIMEVEPNVLRIAEPGKKIPRPMTITRSEGNGTPGGEDGVNVHWYGLEINISQETLDIISTAEGYASYISAILAATVVGIPEAVAISLATGGALILADFAGKICPDGVTLEVYWTIILPYMTRHSIRGYCQ